MEHKQISILRDKGYYIAEIDGRDCVDLKSFMESTAKAFRFPDYYGKNLDAFWECINDLDWLKENQYVLVINNSNELLLDDPENKNYLFDLLSVVINEWKNVPNYDREEKFRNKADFQVIYN